MAKQPGWLANSSTTISSSFLSHPIAYSTSPAAILTGRISSILVLVDILFLNVFLQLLSYFWIALTIALAVYFPSIPLLSTLAVNTVKSNFFHSTF